MATDLIVDTAVYPVDVVMGTAYVFTERCYVLLDRQGEAAVKVSLSAKPGVSEEELKALAGEFQNELLGQALRLRIAERHEKVRETIVARALFGAAPMAESDPGAPADAPPPPSDEQLGLDPLLVPAENDDYLDDPLGIAVPWEEKYPKAAAQEGARPTSEPLPSGTPQGPERAK